MLNYFKSFLHYLEPEFAHNLVISCLKYNLLPKRNPSLYPALSTDLFGTGLSHPIGLAAGFDKNAEAFYGLLEQNFSFVEVGTVTLQAQPGNPKPRIFRLKQDQAIINRLGFNSKGADYCYKKLQNSPYSNFLGINIGRNKSTKNEIDDYLQLLDKFYGLSRYITINISSPNTAGLRQLQYSDKLIELLAAIHERKVFLAGQTGKEVALLLKIAPDINPQEAEFIAEAAIHYQLDGLVLTNTTTKREGRLVNPYSSQQGGLSGNPLFAQSTEILSIFYRLTKGQIVLIGVGGVSTGEEAYQKILHGASLVQIYSSAIYHGFGVIDMINNQLDKLLHRDGFTDIKQAVGRACI